MQRVQHLLAAAIASIVPGHDLVVGENLDAVHVGFDRDGLEGPTPGHAVTVGVEGDRLVLVGLLELADTGVEGVERQCQGRRFVQGEALADGLTLPSAGPVQFRQATSPQVDVEIVMVQDLRHGGAPAALEIVDLVLDGGLLRGRPGHAEQGLEAIVAGQGGVADVHLTLPAAQDARGHRSGVVPPTLPGHAAEELEGHHHPGQDRFDPLGGQTDGEGEVGEAPGGDQHRHLTPAIGEVGVDVAKVQLQPLARIVGERNEGHFMPLPMAADVPPDLIVAAGRPASLYAAAWVAPAHRRPESGRSSP